MPFTRSTRAHRNLLALVVSVVGAEAAVASGIASFTPMGDLPGGSYFSVPMGISADASKVVGISSDASVVNQAVSWTRTGGLRILGDLPGDIVDSRAYAVSGEGNVIVGYSYAAQCERAFRWTELTGMVQLGNTPAGHHSYARAISTDGLYAFGDQGGPSGFFATRWDPSGAFWVLGDLPGGRSESGANACSADGNQATGVSSSSRGDEAFHWTAGVGMVPIGDLSGGGFESRGWGMSADGSVIVGQGTSSLGDEAFRWTSAGGMVALGDIPGADVDSIAHAVSADGSIIVGRGEGPGDRSVAFIWDEANGMRSLRDVLIAEFGLGSQLQGWQLFVAKGISADGMTVTGQGRNPSGQDEGWIVTIPEPSAMVVVVLGIACLTRRR